MIDIDTIKIQNCGNDIVKLSNDLEILIESLFSDLSKINTNLIWVGKSADYFVEQSKLDKNQYINFQKKLTELGKTLQENADNYNKSIKNVNM